MAMSHKGTNYGNHRPPLLEKDPTLQDRIVSLVKAGNYIETACASQGITKQAFYLWLDAGAEGKEPYKSFLDALQKAAAESEVELLARVRDQADTNKPGWMGNMTVMERRWRERWGRSERRVVEVSEDVKQAIADYRAMVEAYNRPAIEAEVVREVEDV